MTDPQEQVQPETPLNGTMPAPAVPIMDTPTAFSVTTASSNEGGLRVALIIQCPVGTFTFLLDAAAAQALGKELAKSGRSIDTGLVLPDGIV